jgi:hypothetical protein
LTPSIFLSHTSVDNRFCERLAGDLQRFGLSVWYDQWEIKVGESLIERVSAGIDSHQYLGVVLSPASVNSAWVQKELHAAMSRELSERRVVVLPILLEDCTLPTFLRDKRWADFRTSYDQGLRDLLRAVDAPLVPRMSGATQHSIATARRRGAWATLVRLGALVLAAATLFFAAQWLGAAQRLDPSAQPSVPSVAASPTRNEMSAEVLSSACGVNQVSRVRMPLVPDLDGSSVGSVGTLWLLRWDAIGDLSYPVGPPTNVNASEGTAEFVVPTPICGRTYRLTEIVCDQSGGDAIRLIASEGPEAYVTIVPSGCVTESEVNITPQSN